MSLQHAAKHLAAHGRGKDTELIHMDKGEIASLQQIAMANGGSLTINPQTGLPEAGFLSALLPMIAGAGLMLIPGMQAGAAGLIVGGLQTARTGSLSKGIMAGLGAYGGAGLAGSAGAAGAGSTTTLDGATIANTPPTPVAPASNVVDVSGSSLTNATPVTNPTALTGQPIGNGPMTNFTDPYANAGFEGSARPLGYQTTPDITGRPLSDSMYSDYGGATKGIPTQTYEVAPKDFNAMNASERASAMGRGASFENAYDFAAANPKTAIGAGLSVASGMQKDPRKPAEPDKDMGQRYSFTGGKLEPTPAPDVPTYDEMLTKQGNYGRQQRYFNSPTYTAISPTAAKDLYNFADGGPVEQMSNNSMMGVNTMYPMANISTSSYGTPDQMAGGGISGNINFEAPQSQNAGPLEQLIRAIHAKQTGGGPMEEAKKYEYNPEQQQYVQQQASGGISDARYNLGGYSDGGRLLRGPGDGVSDSIPAVIGKRQPARLADGEFVVPARIVSELGNGSTEAGARKLYAMMDRIQSARKKTVGKDKVAHNSRSSKYLPA
jgi:hypothetical protein